MDRDDSEHYFIWCYRDVARLLKTKKMSEKPMMQCGHAANATCENEPCCAICAPSPQSFKVVDAPDLSGRVARCSHYSRCKSEKPSSMSLAFFSHHPDKQHDDYYCGCFGWD